MPKSGPAVRRTSAAQEDYLKALHSLAQDGGPVSTSELAERLGVNPASASEMLGKLADKALIVHDPYRGATLTSSGSAVALEVVRHHRILETFLVEVLGYSWDEVHDEAERLEHAISETLEQRMWEALGRPARDPHGHPIPAPDGRLPSVADRLLHEARPGAPLRITRISDGDPEKLRAIRRLGLGPGAAIRVVEGSEWEGPLLLELGGPEPAQVSVPLGLARVIFVETRRG